MLRLEIKKLGEKIEAAIARRAADEPPGPVLAGPDRDERAAQLAELRGLGRAVPPRPVPELLRQAAAVLASRSRPRCSSSAP